MIKIGVGCNAGVGIDGTQHAPKVLAIWIKEPEVMIVQNRDLDQDDFGLSIIVEVVSKLQHHVKQVIDQGKFPLIIGGDHAISMGSLPYKEEVGVLWIDAHGDINTPTSSITKRIHGMPLAHLMGEGYQKLLDVISKPYLKPEQICYVGLRDLDQYEQEVIHKENIKVLHDQDICKMEFDDVLKQVDDFCSRFKKIHISFDCDSINPDLLAGVSTPAVGGLTKRQVKDILTTVFNKHEVLSMDIVEFNPLVETHKSAKIVAEIVELVEKFK